MARRALLPVRRDDRDGSQGLEGRGQSTEALRLDSVVVRDEDVGHDTRCRSTSRMKRIVSRTGWMWLPGAL
jgi:hypothetical protein